MSELRGGFSKPHSVTVITLVSVDYCYVYYLSLPDLLIPAISTTKVHPPNWKSPVYVPESSTSTQGHPPTWALLVSVPEYRLPTLTYSPFRLRSYYMPIYPRLLLLLLASHESSRVSRSCFLCMNCRDNFFKGEWAHGSDQEK